MENRGVSRQCSEKVYAGGTNYSLLDMLPPAPLRVLDCGCGAGDNARVLRARGYTVVGVTISSEEAARAEAHCERVVVADLDAGAPPGLGEFDVVLMSHVLEHLRTPERLLRTAAALLREGGVIAVALPNVLFYRYRLEFLRGKFQYHEGGVMDETHVHFYTFESGARLLQANGYSVVQARAEGFAPLRTLRRILPAKAIEGITTSLCRRWPGVFGIQGLYLATLPPR